MTKQIDRHAAEAMALRGLAWLASDAEAFGGFLALSGLGPQDLKARAGEPEVLAGVLDYLLADEARLLAFAEAAGVDPAAPAMARRRLPGADP